MIFTDNDRSKVNEEIDIDEVDEEVDESEAGDQDESDDQGKDKQPKKPEAKADDESEAGADDKDKKPKDEDKGEEYWKNKFGESTRENQLERERREKAEQKIEELTKPKELTDEVMKQKYPDWDGYDDAVKATLKNQIKLEEKVNTLEKSQSEYHNERKWQGQVDSFLAENTETEKYPIKDKEAFKKFCSKPANKGLNLDILAGAFVFEVGGQEEKPAPKRGAMFESGSGQGATGKHKAGDKKKYTADEAKTLRTQNPKEYERKIRSGELVIDV